MANTPIKTRLSLHRNWKNDLPLKSLWTIDFATRDGGDTVTLGKRINAVFSQYERRENRDWKIEESLIKEQTDSSGENGYLLAQAIAFPNESYNVSTGELPNSGGYLMGYISETRSPYGSQNKLDVTFLETNIDIIDYFIKPWIIANSHKGLIEDGEADKDIKCNITVILYTRDKKASGSSTGTFDYKNSKLEPRKKIVFFNAVPFNVAGDAVSYGDMSITELSKLVSFTFSHYNTVELNDSRSVPSPVPAAVGIRAPRVDSGFIGPSRPFFDNPAIPNLFDGFTPTSNPAATTITNGRFGGPFGNGIQPLTQPSTTGVRASILPSTTPNPAATPTTGIPLPPPVGFPLFTPPASFPPSVPATPSINQPLT